MAANFCFDFVIPESEQESLYKTEYKPTERKGNEFMQRTAELITPSEELLEGILNNTVVTQFIELPKLCLWDENSEKFRLLHLSVKYVESLMSDSLEYSSSGTSQALKSNTDLVTSLYEGGMNIWECSLDLVNFLHKSVAQNELVVTGRKVLELGCGAGLPGILALIHGATVHFQDYNEEVLKLFTIPNVALNINSSKSTVVPQNWSTKSCTLLESLQTACQFSSGDWSSTSLILEEASYDIILTSETIYNIDIQHSLYYLIKYSLKPGGVVFVAAKSYYFGVGGGTEQFVEFVRKDGVFDVCTMCEYNDGVKREILKMEMV